MDLCRRCGGELYRWDKPLREGGLLLCPMCGAEKLEQEETEGNMTLYELSKDYRAHAVALRGRIGELSTRSHTAPEGDRAMLDERIRMLTIMWREARDLAVLTERYYERGYRRNGRYTL